MNINRLCPTALKRVNERNRDSLLLFELGAHVGFSALQAQKRDKDPREREELKEGESRSSRGSNGRTEIGRAHV